MPAWLGGLSPMPDWSGGRALIWVALACWLLLCAAMAFQYWNVTDVHDTDDAMRLVIVRDLVAGRGWFDQVIPRLDPPRGVWLHWSRLLDGGIASMMIAMRAFLSPANAELWTRRVWPLLWILPGVAGGLAMARNLGGRSAVFLAAALMLIDPQLYRQFVPGRIDHHNVQIVMTVIALACATSRGHRARWAAAGGAVSGLGLAVGLEAMPLLALIGASYGYALIRDRKAAGPATAYGLALAGVTAGLFAIETPPWRWSMSFCDEIAVNLVAAIAVAGLGLSVAAALASKVPPWARGVLVASAGAAAAGVYLGIAPQCIHGPFVAMDPAVKPFWFDRIQEVQPLPKMFALQRESALVAGFMLAAALASAIWLVVRQWRAPSPAVLLILATTILAAVTAWFAWRMQDYLFWIGLPVTGAAASYLTARWTRDLMVPSFLAILLLAPSVDGAVIDWGLHTFAPPGPRFINSGPRCFAAKGYRPLAALPPGEVVAPQDLGPFILAFTPHSVVAAPYHRMSREILEVHRLWNAAPAAAEGDLRAMHPDYLVDCPPYPLAAGPKSFAAALRHGVIPPWLVRLTPPKAQLQIYRVTPLRPSVAAGQPSTRP